MTTLALWNREPIAAVMHAERLRDVPQRSATQRNTHWMTLSTGPYRQNGELAFRASTIDDDVVKGISIEQSSRNHASRKEEVDS